MPRKKVVDEFKISCLNERRHRYRLFPYTSVATYRAMREIPEVKIAADPIPSDRKTDLEAHNWWAHKNLTEDPVSGEWNIEDLDDKRRLHEVLLSVGGEETELLENDPDLQDLLHWGHYFPTTVKHIKCETENAYRNSIALWIGNHFEDMFQLTVGYALDEDGIWHPHTWIADTFFSKSSKVDTKVRVLETTPKKYLAYFGVEIPEEETARRTELWKTLNPEDARHVEEKLAAINKRILKKHPYYGAPHRRETEEERLAREAAREQARKEIREKRKAFDAEILDRIDKFHQDYFGELPMTPKQRAKYQKYDD